ncbi:MAG: hypothetical protein U5K54_01095 [Cytophagales bacterium]|nr:hypothetical protein [Cytophagales bacterium]
MGYFNIPLRRVRPLIFSITFGISVDNSIRFLAKYRQELLSSGFFVPRSVSESILETGKSIVYTSVVLFAGFIIFAFSDFGGTVALGFTYFHYAGDFACSPTSFYCLRLS